MNRELSLPFFTMAANKVAQASSLLRGNNQAGCPRTFSPPQAEQGSRVGAPKRPAFLLLPSGFVLLVTIALHMTPTARAESAAPGIAVLTEPSEEVGCVTIAGGKGDARVVFDAGDYPVVQLAAGLFADDVQRVTGRRPTVTHTPAGSTQLIVVGTLGKSALIQQLAAAGKLKNVAKIQGRWEATLAEFVARPFPGVDRALVIVGSDRRGTAYGLMQLSRAIGVSPWYWWADVPAVHHAALALKLTEPQVDAPAVPYRGFFINDEDWGLNPWAAETFDPGFKNIGPKTYEKVFELMLRLRLNYLWPAMHACSSEFGSVRENYELADKYAMVAGSSHCEPMLCNNVHWDEKVQGPWNYRLNRDTIHSYWEDNVKARGAEEAVWTLGIRGIHDRGMETPPTDMPGKLKLMTGVFRDQRELLDRGVSKAWGPVAQCFVPYKEVLPIYDAGLQVPDDVTLVWVDDNFGYIRRLGSPAERSRAGGAGVYWHMSYYGGPHSYTWINTTAPALMWEELHKAWENDARRIWVINVGDIKPMEIGIDYFSRLAWQPNGFPGAAQRRFLHDFATANFGPRLAPAMTDLLMAYYRLGTVRKPELMERKWALSLTPDRAQQLGRDYEQLLDRERSLAAAIPAEARDAYTELIGFPARVLGMTGRIFMDDRSIQEGGDVSANERKIARLRDELKAQVDHYNQGVAGGKWDRMMPGMVTAGDLTAWNSQVRWPWGEKTEPVAGPTAGVRPPFAEQDWRDAAAADRRTTDGDAGWSTIEGLGPSGRGVALLPVKLNAAWAENDPRAPALAFDFQNAGGDAEAWMDFLPTFRLYPGMKLRVAVSVDDGAPAVVEVPGASGAENENGEVRSLGVQDNFVRARVPLPGLAAGKHTLKVHAVDPGVVIDRVHLP